MKISVKWSNMDTSEMYTDTFPVKAPLQAVKVILLAGSDWASPGDADQYVVKKNVTGDPLDEKLSLEDHGIADGAILFLAKA